MWPAKDAPAFAAAFRMAGTSASVRPGMMGATLTPTGMPAAASASIAARRRAGVDVRGSIVRASAASIVVIESTTAAARCLASSVRTSTSRVTR